MDSARPLRPCGAPRRASSRRIGVGRFSILPELVSGRGTARRSRVVEGKSAARRRNDGGDRRAQVPQHISGRNAQRGNSLTSEPRIARCVSLRAIPAIMGDAVDLDSQLGIAAKEVQNVSARRMLAAEFQPARPPAQFAPDQHFGQSHVPAQLARLWHGLAFGLGRNIPEHRISPPPCFAWSPSPRQARGGFPHPFLWPREPRAGSKVAL